MVGYGGEAHHPDRDEVGEFIGGSASSGNWFFVHNRDETIRLVRERCPSGVPHTGFVPRSDVEAPIFPAFTGPNAGFNTTLEANILRWSETLAANGTPTNDGSVRRSSGGVGFNFGYGVRPWGNNIVVNPFVSVDFLGGSVIQTFPGGSSLSAKSNVGVNVGVKVGPTITPRTWVYVVADVGLLNETLDINFIPLVSSSTQTVPGAGLGVGAAILPDFLQGFGVPVSLSLEYEHKWWQPAHYNTPTASPFFNYAFKRESDRFIFGVNVYFSPPAVVSPDRIIRTTNIRSQN